MRADLHAGQTQLVDAASISWIASVGDCSGTVPMPA